MTEIGIPMDLTGWWAAMVPAGTPKPVIDQINKWFVQIVSADDTKKFLNSFGGDPLIDTPDEGAGDVPPGHQGLGRAREARQDRAAGLKSGGAVVGSVAPHST